MLSSRIPADLSSSNLKVEIENVVGSYPPQIQYHNLQRWSHSLADGNSGRDLYVAARVQLDVLQCRFLLQKLNVSRCHASGQELLDLAQEMMAVVLSLWLHRDQLQDFKFALNWIVSTAVVALNAANGSLRQFPMESLALDFSVWSSDDPQL